LALLIKEHGWRHPITVSKRSGKIVSGHCRLLAARKLNLKQVPVDYQEFKSDAEEYAVLIADNAVEELAQIDGLKMADILCELEQANYDLALTALDPSQIEDYINGPQEADAKDDEVAEPPEKAISKPGDLWLLGDHRLLCGDSTKAEDIEGLMNGRKADMVFTDPPYNVDYYGGNRPQPEKARPKPSRQWQKIYSDNLNEDEYVKWLGTVLTNVGKFLIAGAPVYIWNGHRQFGPMYLLLQSIGLKVSCVITWAKESFAIGYGDYNQQTEFCLYGWLEKKGAHRWYGPTNESTLWQVHREPTKEYKHPTQKPLELAERAMRNSSRRGQIVLDAFLGSGTSLIAAEKLSRKCFGIEIACDYCDVIVKRWEQYTGKKATLA
jgi:DNA modification methylase